MWMNKSEKHDGGCAQEEANPIRRISLFLKTAVTYRMMFGAKEATVEKSGKCVTPVLEMLL